MKNKAMLTFINYAAKKKKIKEQKKWSDFKRN